VESVEAMIRAHTAVQTGWGAHDHEGFVESRRQEHVKILNACRSLYDAGS